MGLKDFFLKNRQRLDLEKELKEIRKDIEKRLKGVDRLEEDGYEAFYTYRDTSRMDTEKLLELLKAKELHEAIDVVEVPNSNKVDELVYEGKLSVEEVASCIINGQSKVFNVKPIKGGK